MKVYGSINNRIMEHSTHPKPLPGIGVTMTMYSDRHAGTIVKVTKNVIYVQEDIATRTDSNGMSESQEYSYAANPEGKIYQFWKQGNGTYRCKKQGMGLMIGERDAYHDYSF